MKLIEFSSKNLQNKMVQPIKIKKLYEIINKGLLLITTLTGVTIGILAGALSFN